MYTNEVSKKQVVKETTELGRFLRQWRTEKNLTVEEAAHKHKRPRAARCLLQPLAPPLADIANHSTGCKVCVVWRWGYIVK